MPFIVRTLTLAAVVLALTAPLSAELLEGNADKDKAKAKKKAEARRAEVEKKRAAEAKKRSADAKKLEAKKQADEQKKRAEGYRSFAEQARIQAEKARAEAQKRAEEIRKKVLESQKEADARTKAAQSRLEFLRALQGGRRPGPPGGGGFPGGRFGGSRTQRPDSSAKEKVLQAELAEQMKLAEELRKKLMLLQTQSQVGQSSAGKYRATIAELTKKIGTEEALRDELQNKLKQQYDYMAKLKAEANEMAAKTEQANEVAVRERARARELEAVAAKLNAELDEHRAKMEAMRRDFEISRQHELRAKEEAAVAADKAAAQEAAAREAAERAHAQLVEAKKYIESMKKEAEAAAKKKDRKGKRNKKKKGDRKSKKKSAESKDAGAATWVPSDTGKPIIILRSGDGKAVMQRIIMDASGHTPKPAGKPISARANIIRGFHPGSESARVEEKGRSIRLEERNGTIHIVVVEKKDGDEKVSEYRASSAKDLKSKHPEAHNIYEALKAKGFVPHKPVEHAKQMRVRVQPKKSSARSPSDAKIEVEVEADVFDTKADPKPALRKPQLPPVVVNSRRTHLKRMLESMGRQQDEQTAKLIKQWVAELEKLEPKK